MRTLEAAVICSVLVATACGEEASGGSEPTPHDAGDELDSALPDAGADAGGDADAGGPGYAAGDAVLLSPDNPSDLDEDPSVLVAADGSLNIAYFSRRDGNADLYVKRTLDGVQWTETRITTDPAADFFPTLFQDAAGRFHVTWFRWTSFQVGAIHHASTLDVSSWDESAAQQITNVPDVDDWVPTITESANGDLLVAFASEKRSPSLGSELFLVRKPAAAQSFEPAEPLTTLGSPTHDDTLPVIARDGDDLVLAWVRCDPGGIDPCLGDSAELWLSRSTDDGQSWTAPQAVTSGGGADTLPSIYADHAGSRWLIWISAPSGAGSALEVPLSAPSSTPVPRPELTGYSPHVAATPTPGIFIGAWVQQVAADPNTKDVFARLFAK